MVVQRAKCFNLSLRDKLEIYREYDMNRENIEICMHVKANRICVLLHWEVLDQKKHFKKLLKKFVTANVSLEFVCATCQGFLPCVLNFKMKELLFQGAESRIYRETYLGKDMLVKERFNKNYRHPELDNHLTKDRIKAECRNIVRCKQFGIRTPAIYFVDLENRLIYMEYFESSTTVKEHLQNLEKEGDIGFDKIKQIAELIGESVAKMHFNNIIHGDLTTSNFLLIKNQEANNYELVVIDFGLSHSEASDEDKAVDLYVLERALSSTHVNILEFFTHVLKKYCSVYGTQSQNVLHKFEEVRARGRKRSMVG